MIILKGSNFISLVLLTQNALSPRYQLAHQLMPSIPKEISREIILVDYNLHNGTHLRDRASESTDDNEQKNYVDYIVQHVKV
jgi:hypothetical protein